MATNHMTNKDRTLLDTLWYRITNGNMDLFPKTPKISQRMRWARKEELGGGHADFGIPNFKFLLGGDDVR